MKLIEIPGMKRKVRALEWKEAKPIVEAHLKKYKKFYEALAEV